MNKKELKAYLDKMSKTELEDLIMGIHAQYPRVREFIYDTINPPTIDWEQLYGVCRDYVIEASTSNKMGRIAIPVAALNKLPNMGQRRILQWLTCMKHLIYLCEGYCFLSIVTVLSTHLSAGTYTIAKSI